MDIFEREMAKDTIFKDRNVLSPHYIPDHLPFRDDEINRIMHALAPALKNKRTTNLFLYGKTGTGKTSSTKHVLKRLDDVKDKYNAPVEWSYLNCRIHNTKYQVLLKCAELLNPKSQFIGHPATYLYEQLIKAVEKQGITFVVVLDEIDKVKDLDDLVYSLTRSNDELQKGHIGIIGISNRVNFKDRLDPRSKSTLCQEEMVFKPYNAEQLESILKERVEVGFKPGAVDISAITLASAFAAQESGDARYALRLLLRAGELAEADDQKVTDKQVEAARSAVEEDLVLALISSLPEHQCVVLYSIALLVEAGVSYRHLTEEVKEPVLFSGEVYEKYGSICRSWHLNPRSARWFREYLNDLEMLGLITTMISGKGIRGNTRLIKLEFPVEKVKNAVQKRFG